MTLTIVLDVEGILFKTSLSTLTSVKGSYFDRLFHTDWKDRLDKHGHLFIDRDSTIFPLILNYLRDGSIPLPRDEYYLERILREAKFFNLLNLCLDVERRIEQVNNKRHGGPPRINTHSGNVSPSISIRSETTFDVDRKLPRSPRGSLDGSLPEAPLVPTRRRGKQKKLDSISLPRNFTHVAHVGWNGNGVIFDERLLDNHSTVQSIIDAAKKTDIGPIYNVVSNDNGNDRSHAVEVMLAGSLMQTKDPLYTKPQKKPARLPPKRPQLPSTNSPR
ncbi:unnamed protein product [Cylicocyclus nassatus]|uniref:CRIB domain-containing protein n=1 Tax=Cylicocyclus nassatus TaxID=53992 RepID=A0AA36M5K9_CYLNA|nr:unnamed protein product [Cylicocyclus nassatus]